MRPAKGWKVCPYCRSNFYTGRGGDKCLTKALRDIKRLERRIKVRDVRFTQAKTVSSGGGK